jgi:hypothetical protein
MPFSSFVRRLPHADCVICPAAPVAELVAASLVCAACYLLPASARFLSWRLWSFLLSAECPRKGALPYTYTTHPAMPLARCCPSRCCGGGGACSLAPGMHTRSGPLRWPICAGGACIAKVRSTQRQGLPLSVLCLRRIPVVAVERANGLYSDAAQHQTQRSRSAWELSCVGLLLSCSLQVQGFQLSVPAGCTVLQPPLCSRSIGPTPPIPPPLARCCPSLAACGNLYAPCCCPAGCPSRVRCILLLLRRLCSRLVGGPPPPHGCLGLTAGGPACAGRRQLTLHLLLHLPLCVPSGRRRVLGGTSASTLQTPCLCQSNAAVAAGICASVYAACMLLPLACVLHAAARC